ncbi:MAG: hypothetical protein R3E95_17970 [Thiolinea sp.]
MQSGGQGQRLIFILLEPVDIHALIQQLLDLFQIIVANGVQQG